MMADALVREINRLGYQLVFQPRTGVFPPELYNYEPANRRLVRRGALASYLPQAGGLVPSKGQLAAIDLLYTSKKQHQGAASLLSNALKCIGIDSTPNLDLGFTGAREYAFSITEVTYESIDPAVLDPLIRNLSPTGIPARYVEGGHLHVVYEYAYAGELLMSRADRKDFSHDISGKVGAYLDMGLKGEASVKNSSTLSFKSTQGLRAAFAYKAARLTRDGGAWVLYPEVIRSGKGLFEERQPYIPQPGVVIEVIDSPE
jgi:hypothetical protein